jgi:hypothetical protein
MGARERTGTSGCQVSEAPGPCRLLLGCRGQLRSTGLLISDRFPRR